MLLDLWLWIKIHTPRLIRLYEYAYIVCRYCVWNLEVSHYTMYSFTSYKNVGFICFHKWALGLFHTPILKLQWQWSYIICFLLCYFDDWGTINMKEALWVLVWAYVIKNSNLNCGPERAYILQWSVITSLRGSNLILFYNVHMTVTYKHNGVEQGSHFAWLIFKSLCYKSWRLVYTSLE